MSDEFIDVCGGFDYSHSISLFECVIVRVSYHNEQNGYAVVRVSPVNPTDETKGKIVVVMGEFTRPWAGQLLRCHGYWITHPLYGSQFKLERYELLSSLIFE